MNHTKSLFHRARITFRSFAAAMLLFLLPPSVQAYAAEDEMLVPSYPYEDRYLQILPTPVAFPGETEHAYFRLLCELLGEYGLADDTCWNAYKGYSGVEWADLVDLSGDGAPELAVAVSYDAGEDAYRNDCELLLYSLVSGEPVLLDSFDIENPNLLEVGTDGGAQYLYATRIFYTESGGYTSEGAAITVDGEDVIATPCQTRSSAVGYGAHCYDGFFDLSGAYAYINHDLYETITSLTGIAPASLNVLNSGWERLYRSFLGTDTDELRISRYKLADITGDGIPELLGTQIGDSVPIDNHSSCCVVTYTGDHIRFLVTGGLELAYRQGQVAVNRHSLGHYDGTEIFSYQGDGFVQEKNFDFFFSAAIQDTSEFQYKIDFSDVSEEAFQEALAPYDLDHAFYKEEGTVSSWENTSDGMDCEAARTAVTPGDVYNGPEGFDPDRLNEQQETETGTGTAAQFMHMPDSFPDDTTRHFFDVLCRKIEEYGVGLRCDVPHYSAGTGVLWAKMFDISGNEDLEFTILYSYPDESGETHYIIEIYDNYSAEAGQVYRGEVAQMCRPLVGTCDGIPCVSVQNADGLVQRLTMQSGSIVDLGADAPFTEQFSLQEYVGYYDAFSQFRMIDSELYDTFAQMTGIDPGVICARNAYVPDVVSQHAYYYAYDSDLQLQTRVPGSEHCTDMNTAYAFALKLLVDRYGLSRYQDPYDMLNKCGICDAELVGSNAEGNPYLVVGLEPAEYPGAQYCMPYVFSWEGEQLIFRGMLTGSLFWIASIDGVPAVVSGFAGGEEYGVFLMDGSDRILWYGVYYDSSSGDEEERTVYYYGDRIGTQDEVYGYQSYLSACKTSWPVIKGYASETGDIRFYSANVLNTYEQLTGGSNLLPAYQEKIDWTLLYRSIIERYGQNPAVRFQLLYLDEDDVPELVMNDYSTGKMTVLTSDGSSVEAVCSQTLSSADTPAVLHARDRGGSFLLGFDYEAGTDESASDLLHVSVRNGHFYLQGQGKYDQAYNAGEDNWYDTYCWNGTKTKDRDAFISLIGLSFTDSLVIFWPGEGMTALLSLLADFPPGTVLSVTMSWSADRAAWFRDACIAAQEEIYGHDGSYDEANTEEYDDYDYGYDAYDDYDYEYDEGPADVADAQSDWNAVNSSGLSAGDPFTAPGDFYTDGQERYKETGYILPQSASRYLTEEDIAHLTMKGCCYARNEIYARHGRLFNAAELQDWFDSRTWYDGYVEPDRFDEAYTASVFNEYEYANAYFLLQYENEHGMYWPE